MARPEYCPCKDEGPDPCPACGATVAGDDPVHGVCQARHGAPPEPFLHLDLVDRRTGETVARTTAYR